jgi:hypothetical protein
MTRILSFISFLILTSCLSSKYPTNSDTFEGLLLTCKDDSSTIIVDKEIKLKRTIHPDKKACETCKYFDCQSRPEFFDFLQHWPGIIKFNFKDNSYYFLTNPRPNNPDIKYGEKGFEVHYDLDVGKIKFDKKNKTLELVSLKYNITRHFNFSYSKSDNILTLTEKTATNSK